MATFAKDPDASLLYVVDWTSWLPSGRTISTSAWTIAGPDAALTKDNETIVSGSMKTQIRLLGGTEGREYTITNRIVTDGSPTQTADQSFSVAITQR